MTKNMYASYPRPHLGTFYENILPNPRPDWDTLARKIKSCAIKFC